MIVACIGDNCSQTIDMFFKSIKEFDKIIFVWGMEDNKTKIKLDEWKINLKDKLIIIENKFNQEDKTMNGKARNIYIDFIKKNYPNEYILVMDIDEILEDMSKLKNFINQVPKGVYSPRIRHLVYNLGREDATLPVHFVFNRLFHIDCVEKYQEVEHPILDMKEGYKINYVYDVVLWHFRETMGVFNTLDKHRWNTKKSNIHDEKNLKWWQENMLYGCFPTKIVFPFELPKVIKEEFELQ